MRLVSLAQMGELARRLGQFLHFFLARVEHFSVNNADQTDYFVDKIGRPRLSSGLRAFFLFSEKSRTALRNDGLSSTSLRGRRKRVGEREWEKSAIAGEKRIPLFFPFLPIPYPFDACYAGYS